MDQQKRSRISYRSIALVTGLGLIVALLLALPRASVRQASAQVTQPGLRAQYRAAETTGTTNQIKPHLQIVNGGSASVALSGLKARYYYTREGTAGDQYFCDYAVIGCGNVTGSFGAPSPATSDANAYLEIGFTSGAGSLAANGQTGEIQSRVAKTDWSSYTQSGDYSFDPTKTAFADWVRVTLHQNGTLVWGTPPGGSVPSSPTPANPTQSQSSPTRTATTGSAACPSGAGSILREYWTGVTGSSVANIPVGSAPSGTNVLTSFEAPTNWGDNYGTRVRGFICPPVTGSYTFWIASDNSSELWLSTDTSTTNRQRIAYVSTWTGSRAWTKEANQRSAAITLTAGQRYYIEALHKEATGGDNLAVSWQGPSFAQQVIPGQYLYPPTSGPSASPTRTRTATTGVPPTATRTRTATSVATPVGGWTEQLDGPSGSWSMADGWTNGNPFNNGWRADHVSFSGGIMALRLDNQPCPSGCSNKPYASGEYRTNTFYSYGRVEARFKAARGSGLMAASLFTYTGPSDGKPWDEIDIEILGKNTWQLQTNYFTNGVGGHEAVIDLGFDAAADFHTYAFEWTPSAIRWYVDGRLVHTETGSRGALPTNPGKIMVNMWPGIGVDSWLGPFSYGGTPIYAYYDWIKFTPLS